MRTLRRLAAIFVSLTLVATACGGSDSSDEGGGDGDAALAGLPECPVDAHLDADLYADLYTHGD